MRIWLAKRGKGFIPTDSGGAALHARMADGECAEFTIIRPRSLQMHRKYFGICRTIGENQDPPRDEDSIDMELRVLAGHFDPMMVRDPRSGTLYEIRMP